MKNILELFFGLVDLAYLPAFVYFHSREILIRLRLLGVYMLLVSMMLIIRLT